MDQNTFKLVKCSSLTKSEISFWEKQEVGFEENKVKFDSLNKKKILLIMKWFLDLLKNGAFDEKIENYSVKVQEIENYMDDGSKKKEESDVEKIDEEKETKSKKKKLKEGSHGWRFHSKQNISGCASLRRSLRRSMFFLEKIDQYLKGFFSC